MKPVPRNAPCPCGSGRKHKLCCGTTRDQDRERRQVASVLQELLALPAGFPALRPCSGGFERWARDHADCAPARELIEEGGTHMGPRERRRIAAAAATECPIVWESLRADIRDDEIAGRMLLVGAVLSGLAQQVPLDDEVLQLLEARPELLEDHAEALALALDAGDLWSVLESAAADAALAAIDEVELVARLDESLDDDGYGAQFERLYEERWTAVLVAEARRLARKDHRRRLDRMVERLREQLPCPGSPRASAGLEAACSAFARDRGLRDRVAWMLLGDSLGRLSFAELGLAA